MSAARQNPLPIPDPSGRDCFSRNVAFAWGGYMVNVVSGFVVPRMIDDHLGQVTLGVWDFAWTFVSYFGLVQLGIGGSISRYVAGYRANHDVDGLNSAVSTVVMFQKLVGWLAMALAVFAAWYVLPLFASRLGGDLDTARWVILLQGAEIALYISFSAYGSVIVGCHRWDIHNTVSACAYLLIAVGMIAVLVLGGGLRELALVHCVVMTGGELVRRRLVKRVCPELHIERRLASWPLFVEQARYGLKSLVPSVSNLLSNQFLSLLIVAFLGPASLAVFSRSRSLMTAMRTLAAKFGMIVVPTASALQATNDLSGLRSALLSGPAFISGIALPILLVLAVFGNHVMRLWMGDAYIEPGLIAILCAGTFAALVQEPVWSLLSGMNLHGRVALAKLAAAGLSAVCLTIGLWFLHWNLRGAAVCFILPQVIVDGVVIPWHACQVLGVSKRNYLGRVLVCPGLRVLPLFLGLMGFEFLQPLNSVWAVVLLGLGGMCSCLLYFGRWPQAVTERVRTALLGGTPRKSMGIQP